MKKKLKTSEKTARDVKRNKILFMAIAFAVVITIGVMGYFKFTGKDKDVSHPIHVGATGSIDHRSQKGIDSKLPQNSAEMSIPSADAIKGKWFVAFGMASIAELVLDEQDFQIIYTNDPKGALRKYSIGKYNYDERSGKLTLYPSREMGEPDAVQGVFYTVLTMRNYDIYLKKKFDEADLYFIAPAYTVATKTFHPLFSYADFNGAPVLKFLPVEMK